MSDLTIKIEKHIINEWVQKKDDYIMKCISSAKNEKDTTTTKPNR